jgi:hypothetical protein
MRRIIIFVVIGIIVVFGLTRVFSKGKSKGTNKTTASSSKAVKGKSTGAIKAKTKEEITAEQGKARQEERKRLRELRRRQREEARARRRLGYHGYGNYNYGRRTGLRGLTGRMSAKTGRPSNTILYQLKAIFIVGGQNYAMIDNRNYIIGDEVMGRKIVEILSDRITIDESGQRREVKIGESVLPNLIPSNIR